jgi:hypothetical protein
MEARPEHINRLHGTNQDAKVCMVLYPPAQRRKPPVQTETPPEPLPAESKSEREASQVPRGSAAWDLTGLTGLTNVEEIADDECRFCAFWGALHGLSV